MVPQRPFFSGRPGWVRSSAVAIPTLWTPEQALAVFELLDDLREKLWTLHGGQIQTLLKEEQRHGDAGARGDDVSCEDHSF